jgi:hypothetical protein
VAPAACATRRPRRRRALVLGVLALVGAGIAIAGAAGVGPRGDD